jgi:two-component system sensor histidine kinase BarA
VNRFTINKPPSHKSRSEFLDLFEKNDIPGLENAAHKLHGACCFCGVPYLQQHVVRLENQAQRAKHVDELTSTFTAMLQSIDEVIQDFEQAVYLV